MSRLASTSRLSLEEWDALSPLGETENESISRIQLASAEKSIPSRLATKLKPYSLIGTPNTRTGASPTQTPRTTSAAGQTSSLTSLEITHPIETTQEFHDWFGRVEQSIEKQQEEVYRAHLSELDGYLGRCESALGELDEARGLLSEMEANYRFVEDNSRALQLACETMLDEQKHLVEVSESIGTRLEYFRELETATRMLNLPGETLVLEDDFLNMLDRLDVCLDYLKSNRDFKDAEIYIIRFQQCLTRSMTLIKMYFVTVVRRITAEAAEKMAGQDLSETATNALLYTKFTNAAEPLRILIFELEKRGKLEPAEYSSLLQECYATWFAARSSLLAAPLAEEVRRMEPGSSDIVNLARAGCNHLRAISMSEWSLYKELFSTGETELYQFLESLCDYLYDSLRPRILHEPKIEALCELCTVLGAMMALDAEGGRQINDDSDSDVDDGDTSFSRPTTARRDTLMSPTASIFQSAIDRILAPIGRLRFSVLLRTILQDTQTRLVFRAQAIVQLDVFRFIPTIDDLDYPAILERNAKAISFWEEDDLAREFDISGFRAPREEVQVTWYPTLKRTVWVLSKLHTYVNQAVFEDFAGEAVTLCRQSLSAAAIQLGMKPGNSKIDGQLFLIRHLLFLKEMIRSVDLVQVERAADFSSVTDALYKLLKNTSVILNPNALFELASKGMPNFAETMTDAKTDLDVVLKQACEELIANTTSEIALPIRNFLDQCTTFLSSPNAGSLAAQEWASPEAVLKLNEEWNGAVGKEVEGVVAKLKIYLSEEKTIKVLLPPLLDEIVDTYTTFYNLVRAEYDFSTSSSLTTPTQTKEALDSASS